MIVFLGSDGAWVEVWLGSHADPAWSQRCLACCRDSEWRHPAPAVDGRHRADGWLDLAPLATGVCDQKLEGHTGAVRCLAVSGTRLVSGSDDNFVKIWVTGAEASWQCERTLVGHTDRVVSLATWQGKVLSGSDDTSVRVWDVGTGARDATLTGHHGSVRGLAVHGDRFFSASGDGTIREWALGTWAAARTVEAYGPLERQCPCCLAVSGSKLISGSTGRGGADEAEQYEVRVWDLGSLECEHTLLQPIGAEIFCLVAGSGAVWVGVGEELVVWGRS